MPEDTRASGRKSGVLIGQVPRVESADATRQPRYVRNQYESINLKLPNGQANGSAKADNIVLKRLKPLVT